MVQRAVYVAYPMGVDSYALSSISTSNIYLKRTGCSPIILHIETSGLNSMCLKYNPVSNVLVGHFKNSGGVFFIPLTSLSLSAYPDYSRIKWVSHGVTIYGNTVPTWSGGCVRVESGPRRGTIEYNFADGSWYNYPWPDDGCLCTERIGSTLNWWIMGARWPDYGSAVIQSYYIDGKLIWSGYGPWDDTTVAASGSVHAPPMYESSSWTVYSTGLPVSSCDVDYFTGDIFAFCNSSSTNTIFRFDMYGNYKGVYGVYNFSSTPTLRYGSFIPYDANWIHIPQERWQYKVQKDPIATWDGSWTYFNPWIGNGWPCQIDAAYNPDMSVRGVYTMGLSSYGMRGYPYNKATGAFSTQTSAYGCATYGSYGTNTWVVNNDYMIYQSGNDLYKVDTSTGTSTLSVHFPYVIRNIAVSKSIKSRTAFIATTAGVFCYNPYQDTCITVSDNTDWFFATSIK